MATQTSPDQTLRDEEKLEVEQTGWEPISTPQERPHSVISKQESLSRPGTRGSRRSISRVRSNNGYGVDEDSSSTEEGDLETGPEEKDPFEVGWEGGDADPLNPRSKGKGSKWLIVIICSISSFVVTCTSSIFSSTYTQIMDEFNSSQEVATLGLSLFVMGLGIGPMALGPLSEFYGRRPIYLASFTFFVIWLIPSAVAKNMETTLIARFFDGLSGSAFLSVAGGTVGDLFTRQELQAPMMIFTAAPFVGPSIGPLLGGFINYNTSWRWTFYMLIIWAAGMLAAIFFFVPETYHPVLLKRKAEQIRKDTGDERWKAPLEKSEKSVTRTIITSLYRPFQLLIFESMCLSLCLLSAILLGIMYLFFGAFALVFKESHGFNLWQVGLTFMGLFIGMMIAISTDPLWHRNYQRLVRNYQAETGIEGATEPEFRLPPAILGAVLVPIAMFWFGWTTYSSVHWIVPIIASGLFGMGMLFCYSGIFTFLVDAYPQYAASALAANSFTRSSFAAAFPLFGVQMYEKLGFQWASSLLGFLALAMLPFPYIFFRYGKHIRRKSRYAKST